MVNVVRTLRARTTGRRITIRMAAWRFAPHNHADQADIGRQSLRLFRPRGLSAAPLDLISMSNTALYYPNTAFKNPVLLKSLALYYESIFRIVPDGLIPDDIPGMESLLEDDAIGIMIDPVPFASRASEKGSMRSPVETTRCRGVGFTPKVADPQYPATTGGTVRSGHPDQSIGV